MTEARQKMWAKKVSQSVASAPKLSSLPPTTESFAQNAARAHLQVAVSRNHGNQILHKWNQEILDGQKELARRCIQHLFQMALHLHQMLCLELSNDL